ncbi:MAG TPA: alpha/beta fold hydrolase [Candidatus Saccharimonadales bacterium]|nr:alpha/beta fold hydrolase [Candidatus Saccharimonadales bacterium]
MDPDNETENRPTEGQSSEVKAQRHFVTIAWILAICLLGVHIFCFKKLEAKNTKTQKRAIRFHGRQRTYYLYVPEGLAKDKPTSLLVLFHGSGHDGDSLIKPWSDLASREGLILVAPNSLDSSEWNPRTDPPDLIREIVNEVEREITIDPTRIYLFGHSAGGVYALYLGLYESDYFAAIGVHAAALMGDDRDLLARAPRKIPIAIWIGNQDQHFPLSVVRDTSNELIHYGFPVRLIEMPGHDHNYYAYASSINEQVWTFLKANTLGSSGVWN